MWRWFRLFELLADHLSRVGPAQLAPRCGGSALGFEISRCSDVAVALNIFDALFFLVKYAVSRNVDEL